MIYSTLAWTVKYIYQIVNLSSSICLWFYNFFLISFLLKYLKWTLNLIDFTWNLKTRIWVRNFDLIQNTVEIINNISSLGSAWSSRFSLYIIGTRTSITINRIIIIITIVSTYQLKYVIFEHSIKYETNNSFKGTWYMYLVIPTIKRYMTTFNGQDSNKCEVNNWF